MTQLLGDVCHLACRGFRWLLPAWLQPTPDSHGSSRWADRRALRSLLRSPGKAAVADGIVVGWWSGRLLQTPTEDNAILFGVQRSGKTSAVVVPTLVDWRGALVATSTKHELVTLTGSHRQRLAPVHVFAPLERDHSWIEDLGLQSATWNPIAAIDGSAAAAELADLFTAEGKRGPSSHWYLSAASLLTALFLVERERGGDLTTVLRRLNRMPQVEYLALSGVTDDPTASDLLLAYANTPDREAGSIASTARSCLSLWIDHRVARATQSSVRELDLDQLLAAGETLYLVAPAEEAERCRPLFSALLQALLRRATERARELGGILRPRLLLALDEAANFTRIPRLASYVSTGPGQGIQVLLAFHDLAQVEGAYGEQEARTIWNNCRARLLLPGQADLKTLDQFSRAIGEETRLYRSSSHDRRGSSSSEQRVGRRLVSADELRRMTDAVLVYANAAPARLELRRWDQVPRWRASVLTEANPSRR